MKVSLNTIKQYIDFDLPPVDELVARINAQLGGVEEVIDLGTRYKDALVVKVTECDKHPDADKLSVCMIDDGSGKLTQVVCGAPNVKKDMWAVWLPPKSTVPSTYTDKEPFVLDARELRGKVSHGMLASSRELGLGDDHTGIVDLSENDLLQGKKLKAGANFAEMFGLNDTIIDIENKMFTHRPDLFGQLGVAREIAGIFHHQFTSPDWYLSEPKFAKSNQLKLSVFSSAKTKASRAMFVAMSDVKVGPSPLWLQCALVAMGSKSINNIVDLTNYIMLLTAQPVHAYDYDKIRGQKIGVRLAKKGESVKLLNGKTYQLDAQDIVIADGEGAIGLAGIMGGSDSEVSDQTTNIVLEVANFDMYTVRRSSMRHGLFTDALTRFNKGQSPHQNDRVLHQLIDYIQKLTGAKQASPVYDEKLDSLPEYQLVDPLIEAEFINQRLGLSLSDKELAKLLANVEFDAHDAGGSLCATAPFWRTDIADPEDIVEEVGRLYGFDKLPRQLPRRSIQPEPINPLIDIQQRIRQSLSRAGANEVLTYSFVHEKTMLRAEQDVDQAFRLSNALSPDLQYYRLTVLPSLLDKVHANIKSGHDEFCLFEIGKGHNKKYHADDDDGLPSESRFVDAVYASKKPAQGAAYYQIQRLLSQLASDLGFELSFEPIREPLDFPVTAPFDQSRSAIVKSREGDFVGMIGEFKQSVIKNFKLPSYSSGMTLDLESIVSIAQQHQTGTYQPLSRYPSVSQDISLKLDKIVAYQDLLLSVEKTLKQADDKLLFDIRPLGIYQPKTDSKQKTITLRVTIKSYDRTLKSTDASKLIDKIALMAKKKFKAQHV